MVPARLPASLTTPADADPSAVSVEAEVSDPSPGCESTDLSSPGPAGVDVQVDPEVPAPVHSNGMEEYARLQRRLLIATAWAIAVAVPLCGVVWDGATALSLLLGGCGGLLYVRLLARSVSRLGGDRKSVGKVQLLVPVVLVLAAARIPALQMLPMLLGFLLYKPALIVQALLDS